MSGTSLPGRSVARHISDNENSYEDRRTKKEVNMRAIARPMRIMLRAGTHHGTLS